MEVTDWERPWIWIFDIFCYIFRIKVLFLVSIKKNEISPLLIPWKNLHGYFWKNPVMFLLLEKSFQRPCGLWMRR